jgi:type III pantothenate kinase
MDAMLLLTVDSGNTHIKWGLHDGHSWLKQGVVAHDGKALLEPEWQDMAEPARILVSHVGDTQAKADLSELFSRWKAKPQWIAAVDYQCGVRNYYTEPAQLGSDRWAALIAAWGSERQGCLVVDIGTATTVDALSDTGEFLGGIILPGVDLMQTLLIENTASLKPGDGKFRDYPDNTADAIYSGTIHALGGAVERMAALLTITLGHTPNCILSGGGAQHIQSALNVNTKVVDNLVLEGLKLIAHENSEIPL